MLLIVTGLLLALYFFKRWGSSRGGLLGGTDLIRVLATRHLAPKNFITLVEIGDSVLTLGVTSENITILDKAPSAAFHKNTELKTNEPDRNSFAYRLKALTGQGFALAKTSNKQ
ncbi:MAG: flagellar biosynthetic protein FliO [Deltaproteobacteria bacterium]|nr:flagellar biosynthetic protein FliO [Deltaproteobacteria bacterium]